MHRTFPIRLARSKATERESLIKNGLNDRNALIVIEIRCKFLKLSALTISNSLHILFCYVFLQFTPPTLQTSLFTLRQNRLRLQTEETSLQGTDKQMANICRKIFFIIPVTFFPFCAYSVHHHIEKVWSKLCNTYYKLSNTCYKVCNAC